MGRHYASRPDRAIRMKQRRPVLVEDAVPDVDDNPTVRIVDAGEGVEYAPPPPSRTPMQRTQDDILDNAEESHKMAAKEVDVALDWLDLLVDLPTELRHKLPALLNDLGTLIDEERRLRQ